MSPDGRLWWNGFRWQPARRRLSLVFVFFGVGVLFLLPMYAIVTWAAVAGDPGPDLETQAQIAHDERVRTVAGDLFVVLGPAMLIGGISIMIAGVVMALAPLRIPKPGEQPSNPPRRR